MESLRGRRSVRRFRDEPLPEGTLEKLIEAARWAPSASNRQAWRIIAVESALMRSRMRAAVGDAVERLRTQARPDMSVSIARYMADFLHFEHAPLVLVPIFRIGPDLLASACADAAGRVPGADALASVSAAIQNVLLAAHALGLGACWMTGPLAAAPALASLLDVPEGWQLAALVPVGAADEAPPPPPRRELARLLQRAG